MHKHSGVFTGDSNPNDQKMFIVEQKAFQCLCENLVRPCSCHWGVAPWRLDKFVQVSMHMIYQDFYGIFSIQLHRKDMLFERDSSVFIATPRRLGLAQGTLEDVIW